MGKLDDLKTKIESIKLTFTKNPNRVLSLENISLKEKEILIINEQFSKEFALLYESEKLVKDIEYLNRLNKYKINFENLIREVQILINNQKLKIRNMSLTSTEFQSYAGKIIPEFDGSAAELTRFLDALELVAENVGNHMATAVKLIKTKLRGDARCLITDENTIEQIILTLKKNIRHENSEMIIGKLMNLKAINKSSNNYVKEVEEISMSLKRAYISEGTSLLLAEKFATQQVVSALKSNAHTSEIKTIIKAGSFSSVAEVLTKYTQVVGEKEPNHTISHYRGNRNFQSRGNRYNNYRGNYRGRGQYNFNKYNYNNNKKQNQNNYFKNNRGRGNFNNNRPINYTQGNEEGPQEIHLEAANQ